VHGGRSDHGSVGDLRKRRAVREQLRAGSTRPPGGHYARMIQLRAQEAAAQIHGDVVRGGSLVAATHEPAHLVVERSCASMSIICPTSGMSTSSALDFLVVSKVANFSIDLPEANVVIQLSGAFGSHQEEAQLLGRLLRPKADAGTADFYAVVARDTVCQTYVARRQRFLTEQGYSYHSLDAEEAVASRPRSRPSVVRKCEALRALLLAIWRGDDMRAFLGRPLLSSELGLEVPVDLTVERMSEIG
jgi:hypothetical protein